MISGRHTKGLIMSFVSKAIRITTAVATVGISEATGVPQGIAVAKRRSNDKHQTNLMADAIRQASGQPTSKQVRQSEFRAIEDRRQSRRQDRQAAARDMRQQERAFVVDQVRAMNERRKQSHKRWISWD